MTFLRIAFWIHSTVAPPIVNIRPITAELPAFNARDGKQQQQLSNRRIARERRRPSAMSKQTSVELPNMSPEDNLGNHAVVKRKRARPGKQTEVRFDESTTDNKGKRAKVTASSTEQQRADITRRKR